MPRLVRARVFDVLRLLTAFAIGSCGHESARSAQSSAPRSASSASATQPGADRSAPAAAVQESTNLKYHREARLWEAVLVRDAVIAGDIVAVRREAAKLEKARPTQLPDTWRNAVAQIQQSAAQIALVEDIDGAAQWTASIAVACGNCHRYSGQVPVFREARTRALTADEQTLRDRMQRHARVAEELWLGLLGAEDAWRRGSDSLNEAPPEPTRADATRVDDVFAAELNRIKALGITALSARTIERRASVYGDLIARCAHCHPFARPE